MTSSRNTLEVKYDEKNWFFISLKFPPQKESEKLVAELFKLAEEKAPSVIFIDEIDSICGSREKSEKHESSKRLLTEFLTRMTNMKAGVLVVLYL